MRSVLPGIAREAIASELGVGDAPDREKLVAAYPELLNAGACFVTLSIHGALRGCIGSLQPYRALIDDLIGNACAAAFEDPRFAPLEAEEYARMRIEVSLLSVPEPLPYADKEELKRKIRPGVDGVVLELDGRRATFLPQVWEQLSDFEHFFAHLGMKAGLGPDVLERHPHVSIYRVEKIGEAS